MQLAHLAPTYAGITALLVNGGAASYECLDRQALYGFLMRMKDPCGGFRMHDMGELDMRGTCANFSQLRCSLSLRRISGLF